MFRILFIDEEKDDIDYFQDYVDEKDSEGEFEVIWMYPKPEIREMIDRIVESNVDAVITDFMLNEIKTEIKYNVPYNGTQLVQAILDERESFPCFVLTSFDDEAVDESQDVNIVYIKGILHQSEADTKAKANFLDRIKNQIIHHRTKIDKAESRLLNLIAKNKSEGLDAYEQDEMIELDNMIEKSLDKRSRIPDKGKERNESESISKLLDKVDDLMKKIDSSNE